MFLPDFRPWTADDVDQELQVNVLLEDNVLDDVVDM